MTTEAAAILDRINPDDADAGYRLRRAYNFAAMVAESDRKAARRAAPGSAADAMKARAKRSARVARDLYEAMRAVSA